MKIVQFKINLDKRDSAFPKIKEIAGVKSVNQGIIGCANPELNKISYVVGEDSFDESLLRDIEGVEIDSIVLLRREE